MSVFEDFCSHYKIGKTPIINDHMKKLALKYFITIMKSQMIVLLQASKSNTEEKQRFILLRISQKWLKTMHITADQ